jgi:hypothetical protein
MEENLPKRFCEVLLTSFEVKDVSAKGDELEILELPPLGRNSYVW